MFYAAIGGYQDISPENPKDSRVAKMSFGTFWKVNCSRKSLQFGHLQNIENDTRKCFKTMQPFPIKFKRYCGLGFQKGKKYYKPLKHVDKIGPWRPEGPKLLRYNNHYITEIRVHVARTLCTLVRATGVFSKSKSE